MTRDEFKILVKAMKAVYTHPTFIPDQHAFDIWYEMLKDIDYKTASFAIKKYMQSEEREPSVASIRKYVLDLTQRAEKTNEMEAWTIIQKAIRNSLYHAEEEFNKLPQIVQKAVVHPRQLREWAMMENVDGRAWNVMQSNFMRTYRAEVEKENEIRRLSPDLLKLMSQNSKEKIGYEQSGTKTDAKAKGGKLFSTPYELDIKLHD